jgi:beta-mannanase/cell division septation protein DedD
MYSRYTTLWSARAFTSSRRIARAQQFLSCLICALVMLVYAHPAKASSGIIEAGTNLLFLMPRDAQGSQSRAQNQSRLFSPASASTSSIQSGACGALQQEAEVGTPNGRFTIGSDSRASGGKYVHVANGTGSAGGPSRHYMRYCFNVSTTGRYRIQAKVYAATSSDDSFFVTVDGTPTAGYLWEFSIGSYQDDYVSSRGGADPVILELVAGQHLVDIYLREDGARLDKVGLELIPSPTPAPTNTLLPSATPSARGYQSVSWEHVTNAVAESDDLSKSGTASAWDAGAVSAQQLSAGDGGMCFRVQDANGYRMVGLGTGNTSQSYSDIEYAWYLYRDNRLIIYESGVSRIGLTGGFAVGDILEIRVENGTVRYYHNGVLRYQSTITPVYPLAVDTSLYHPNTRVADVALGTGGCAVTSAPSPMPTWTPTATQTPPPMPTWTPTATQTPSPTPTWTPTATQTPPSAPSDGASIYWGAYVRNAPWNMADLDAFNAVTGKAPAILHFGYPWKQSGQMKSFPTAVMNQIRQRGSIPLIGWGSWDASKGPEQPEFQLRDITEGHYDSYIREWAQQAKAWEHPFFLKFNWEMDGRWQFPWSVQLNGNTTGDFVPAWRHVHDIFEQEGATNVTWVWCPNHLNRNSVDPALVYPGDAYVDWTCIHGYNFGGSNWRTFREIYSGYDGNPRDSYTYMLNLAPSKPIMIGEWASNEAGDGGAAKAAWIRDALQVQLPRYYPQIRAVVWMNWNCCGESWVVNSSEPARQAIFESLASPFYASNQYGQLGTSPIPPPN